MELTARIHIEDGSYWADVPELPGCFASGDTLDELFESLQEGVALYLADEGGQGGGAATSSPSERFPLGIDWPSRARRVPVLAPLGPGTSRV